MRRAGFEPGGGIIGVDAAANLQSARIGLQGGARLELIAGPEHDEVAARKTVAPVELRKPRRVPLGNKICPQCPGSRAERAAHDLLYLALV